MCVFISVSPLTNARSGGDAHTLKMVFDMDEVKGVMGVLLGAATTADWFTLAAMDAAVMWEEELSSVDATPLSFFSSSSSSHCTPLSSVCRRGELLGGGERGGGGDGRSSSSSAASFTFTTASRSRSMAWGSAGRMN